MRASGGQAKMHGLTEKDKKCHTGSAFSNLARKSLEECPGLVPKSDCLRGRQENDWSVGGLQRSEMKT